MRLLRADISNGVFESLERQWSSQCDRLGESYEEFSSVHIDHAREVVEERGGDRYAIYVLTTADGVADCIAHINVARLPRTTGATLRVRGILLAPMYDYRPISHEKLENIGSILFGRVARLASGGDDPNMKADHVKIHLNGLGDREMLTPTLEELSTSDRLENVGIRGNWLEFSINDSLAFVD